MRKRYPKIENLNQKLKMLRVYHNYTQSEIAKILDVNRSTYAYYETDFLLDISDEENQKF